MDELFNEVEAERLEERNRRVASGEEAAEIEAFRIKREAENERLIRNGCIESEEDRADDEGEEE